MIRYRLAESFNAGPWLSAIWHSSLVRQQLERRAKTTAGIFKISQGDISGLAIPVPPIEEQAAATSLLTQRLGQITHLQLSLASVQNQSSGLRQAILRRAFTGQLADQDATDEPASALLERIAAERAKVNPAAPKRSRKRKQPA